MPTKQNIIVNKNMVIQKIFYSLSLIICFVLLIVFIVIPIFYPKFTKITNSNIDCSGNWNEWSDCNKITGTKTRTFNIIRGRTCPSSQTLKCDIDCSGDWNAWTDCNEITGTRTRTFNIIRGRTCPSSQTLKCDIDCSDESDELNNCDKNTESANQGTTESANQGTTESANQGTTESANQGNTESANQGTTESTLCLPGYIYVKDNFMCIPDENIIIDQQEAQISCNVAAGFIKNGNSCICNIEAGFIKNGNSCICNVAAGFIKNGNSCECVEGKYKDKSECKNSDGVWIYENNNYSNSGDKKFLPKGNYQYVHFNEKYNTISSIKIQGNIKLKLYDLTKYRGTMKETNKSIPKLSEINFHNKISSIKMY